MNMSFGYKFLGRCQYDMDYLGRGLDCGEPAIAEGWWSDDKGIIHNVIDLCEKHLTFIREQEAQ